MFTFTKTVVANEAYVVEWSSGNRIKVTNFVENFVEPTVSYFETLEEAEKFIATNTNIYHAKIYKKEFIKAFRQGQQYEDVRDASPATTTDIYPKFKTLDKKLKDLDYYKDQDDGAPSPSDSR